MILSEIKEGNEDMGLIYIRRLDEL